MKHIKHLERATIYPAVIGYNRLLTDNKPTHKFLLEIGTGQQVPNYELLIEFTQRFLTDLHTVDKKSHKKILDMMTQHNNEDILNKNHVQHNELHRQICQRINDK